MMTDDAVLVQLDVADVTTTTTTTTTTTMTTTTITTFVRDKVMTDCLPDKMMKGAAVLDLLDVVTVTMTTTTATTTTTTTVPVPVFGMDAMGIDSVLDEVMLHDDVLDLLDLEAVTTTTTTMVDDVVLDLLDMEAAGAAAGPAPPCRGGTTHGEMGKLVGGERGGVTKNGEVDNVMSGALGDVVVDVMTALGQDEALDGMLVGGMTGGGVSKGVTTAVTKGGGMMVGLVSDGPLELVSDTVKGGKGGADNVHVEQRGVRDKSLTAGDLMLGTMTTEPGLLQDEVVMDNVLDETVMNDGMMDLVAEMMTDEPGDMMDGTLMDGTTALAPRARCATSPGAAHGWNRAPP